MSAQLSAAGWNSALCFTAEPSPTVAEYLRLPNVSLHVLGNLEFNNTQVIAPFVRLIRKVRPSVLHLQFTPDLSLFPLLAKTCGVRRALFTSQTSRATPHAVPFSGIRRHVARMLMRPVDNVIAISDFVRQWYSEWGVIDASRVRRVYNAIDISRCSPAGAATAFRNRFQIPHGRPVISQVATISREKGVHDLLGAARLVLEKTNAQFVFAGDGPALPECRRLAAELGIDQNVTWAGLIEDPVAEGVYAATAVSCLCSRWQEAFGWVLAEAMNEAVPIVGTRTGAIPEIVEHDITGLLAPPGDVPALASNILDLLSNAEKRHGLGLAGQRKARQQYDIRRTVAEIIGLYGIPVRASAAARA